MIFGVLGVGTGVGTGSFASRMFGAGKNMEGTQDGGTGVLSVTVFRIEGSPDGPTGFKHSHIFYNILLDRKRIRSAKKIG
jgi:hypothetical protein